MDTGLAQQTPWSPGRHVPHKVAILTRGEFPSPPKMPIFVPHVRSSWDGEHWQGVSSRSSDIHMTHG